MDPSLLYQDNTSDILLKTNGRASSSKRTKHIKVKYFLIKDKVDWEEITIEHCPAEQMWMDINTKPKQGAVFRAFRGHVMGIPADYNDASFVTRCNFRPPNWAPEPVSMLPIPKDRVAAQECVGEQVTSNNKEVEIWDKSSTEGQTGHISTQIPTSSEGSVCCRRGGTCRTNCRTNQTGSTCTNQDGERTCVEPGDLPDSETTGEDPRCSMGESVYPPSHFILIISDY